jgi:hypothetical protein
VQQQVPVQAGSQWRAPYKWVPADVESEPHAAVPPAQVKRQQVPWPQELSCEPGSEQESVALPQPASKQLAADSPVALL